ncbi:MFS transporter [Pectobacterium cacticida]|uniref:MFS transporter n=1 Tax=Pectobacterium cacticida TaxID=69221 RepID=A0ABZ2GBM2_9GAMM|nr:MFS transporter [Pectobacterium cacticida]UYX06593.1 MFS transporter [Pectobacterium cacticida]
MSSTKMPVVIWMMAIAAGLGAANLHYSQPLLPSIAASLQVSLVNIGWLPALTQIGFALGIFFLLPLSDRFERRRLIVILLLLVSAALLLQGLAATPLWLLSGGFLLGLWGVVPQLLIPFASLLAPAGRAGQASGLVLSGVLSGVLLSKVLAGLVATASDWRTLYFAAATLMVLLAIYLRWVLPKSRQESPYSYPALLASSIRMAYQLPALRRHTMNGGITFALFMAFWGTYAVWLQQKFHYGPDIAGLFGLAGMAGAFAASLAGKAIDRGQFRRTQLLASLLMLAGFLCLFAADNSLIFMVIGLLLLDSGAGLSHSANQNAAFALDSQARGRINSIYMCGYFIGGAVGILVATRLLMYWGWFAVCSFGVILACILIALEWSRPRHKIALPRHIAQS